MTEIQVGSAEHNRRKTSLKRLAEDSKNYDEYIERLEKCGISYHIRKQADGEYIAILTNVAKNGIAEWCVIKKEGDRLNFGSLFLDKEGNVAKAEDVEE